MLQKIIEDIKIKELTPVIETKSGIYLKRDDTFTICGVSGGKARSAYQVIVDLINQGYDTIVTAGSRQSPQCEIVSYICESLNIQCKLFMPKGQETSVIRNINNNKNTEIIRVTPAYNNVIISRAYNYAKDNNFGYVPFGMECAENVKITSEQVVNIPKEVKRIVIPVGSGMSFASVATGLNKYKINKPLIGIQVGKDPIKTINKYCPLINFMDYKIIQSHHKYHTPITAYINDIQLDPIYEAKCYEFLEEGDLLWIVGKRILED